MNRITWPDCSAYVEEYLVEGTPKGAVLVCPGGGYAFVSDREAGPIARAFNEAGYHAFVLWYQVNEELRPLKNGPLQEAARAMAYIRSHASDYALEEKKFFVCGFSAGGHLAASLGTLWKDADRFLEGTDLELQRPDGMILSYPVISSGEYAHRGSFENLAGPDLMAQQQYSLEKLVTEDAVPAFLWHTAEDQAVPVQNSFLMAEALMEYGIPVELHVFPFGPHGLSLATEEVAEPECGRFADTHVAQWIGLSVKWMSYLTESCRI